MPSKIGPSNSRPQSSPGKRSSSTGVTLLSRGSKTSRSTVSSSASQSHTIMSVSVSPLTVSTRMPGSIPTSHAGDSGRTFLTSAPSPGSGSRLRP